MHSTIQRLMNGDVAVVSAFAAAFERWTQIASATRSQPVESLATRIYEEQMWFEENCGTRYVGQEVMAWVAIAQFYRSADGLGSRDSEATRVLQAIRASGCSVEVVRHAERAANYFGLIA